jgi:hypothetical protein
MLTLSKLPTRLARQETETTVFFVSVPAGFTAEDVQNPEFWQFVARRLKVNDRIEIVTEDGTLDMDVRVTAVDPRFFWAHVRVLRVTTSAVSTVESEKADPDGYIIEWGGPTHRFRIIDRGKNLIERDFPSRDAAMAKLAEIKAAKQSRAA